MIIWTVSDVVTVVLFVMVIFGFMILGMLHFIAFILDKLSKWREKRWERRHGRS